MTQEQIAQAVAALLEELRAIRFAHLIVKPKLTMPAKVK